MAEMTKEQVASTLRVADEKALSDEDVALLTACYIEFDGQMAVNATSLASGMWMLAGRRVSVERAEHLIDILWERELVEPNDSDEGMN